jgi:hypothetical protein
VTVKVNKKFVPGFVSATTFQIEGEDKDLDYVAGKYLGVEMDARVLLSATSLNITGVGQEQKARYSVYASRIIVKNLPEDRIYADEKIRAYGLALREECEKIKNDANTLDPKNDDENESDSTDDGTYEVNEKDSESEELVSAEAVPKVVDDSQVTHEKLDLRPRKN